MSSVPIGENPPKLPPNVQWPTGVSENSIFLAPAGSYETNPFDVQEKAMSKLEQIEKLRKELVTSIADITGLPIGEITVDISLSGEGEESSLAIEARDLGWYPDKEQESVWYTSEIPEGGSTTLFME